MTPLEKRMVLHKFMCDQFAYIDLRGMLDCLARFPKESASRSETHFAQALIVRLPGVSHRKTTTEDISRYDANIVTHSDALGMTEEKGKSWKPFQYLALLFTERYLDLYFQDAEVLAAMLNEWKKNNWPRLTRAEGSAPDYTTDDLRVLAFQSATGSGKTLLLHANILQYKHYLAEYKQLHKLNKIILVTPDEGLSRQHLRELQSSGILARLFSDNSGADVSSGHEMVVDIIDLHKLDEKKGVKRVALGAFEDNNLVMVDEGHLGTGGKVWRSRRKQLATNGFTFEYSATFNQAVAGGGEDVRKLRDEYGKCILFDYSYKFFYGDGYGKDYHISNLQNTDDGEANNAYLLACLLKFHQQCLIYANKSGQWRDFNLAPPLWVFLGKTVTGGKVNKETETDVAKIINFLSWVQHAQTEVTARIGRLISGNTGLADKHGVDIFSGAFPHLGTTQPQAIYDQLRDRVFHGKGQLHITHLTGSDELQIRAGDAEPFAVINVGNASGLYAKLDAVEDPPFTLSKDAFSKPLFADVDSDNSPVNIVIGARRFVAGWNSWRVSTMGLLHVGTGEGPQIIQMFGRGVRLKGRGMSLKRHTKLDGEAPPDSDQLKFLETLNIFGLKANYMDKFKDYMKDYTTVERVVFNWPTQKQFSEVDDLKILKKRDDVGEFEYSDKRIELPSKPRPIDYITIDRRKHLQVLASERQEGVATNTPPAEASAKLGETHLALINTRAIYSQVLERKSRTAWHNMRISQTTVDQLLESTDWYTLHIAPEKLEPSHYGRVREWEKLAVDLICEYANRHWRRERNAWEHAYIEAVPLNDDNANYFDEYKISVDVKDTALIAEIKKLLKDFGNEKYPDDLQFGEANVSILSLKYHAYIPLLTAAFDPKKSMEITPVPLNPGEANFVRYLSKVITKNNLDVLQGKEVCLMRNLSRGKGVSFFDDYAFYPDFILWVKGADRQDSLFIDPKGLAYYNSNVNSKVQLHKYIKDIEKKLQKDHADLFLHSYIWSPTQLQKIGTDVPMTPDQCRKMGIFFASDGTRGIKDLLQNALK